MPRNKAFTKKRSGANGTARKKIVIKPFSKPPTLPENYYEKTSGDLLDGTMNIIFNPSVQQLSLQNSYQEVVNLVSHQYGPRLYKDLIQALRKACEVYVLPRAETTHLLSHIQTQYQKYVDYLLLCKDIFLPLDRTHALTTEGDVLKRIAGETTAIGFLNPTNGNTTMGLWQVGLEQFRLRLQQFQLDDLIYQKWWESLQLDWDGNLALDQQTLLQSTLYMWQDMAILAETLSHKLEPDLIKFFYSKSEGMKSDNYSATAVISYCHSKWMHVVYHWSRFLPKSTCVTLLENNLFQPHLQNEWLLEKSNFDPLVEEGTSTSNTIASPIQQLWMLAGRLVGGYKLVAGGIARYAKKRGLVMMQSINDSKAGKQKIAELLQLQSRLQKLLSNLPHAAEHCALKHVWEDVVNPSTDSDTNAVAEALAKYVDAYMKDAKKQQPESNWASNIISGIFCYLQAKDVFEAFYKKDLAKRLLWNRIVSMDVERNFVSLLKAECGAGYTAKMEGMFQDMDWSRETMTRYKQSTYQDGPNDQLEMDIQVLTTGYWPVYQQYPNLILPQALQEKQEHFLNYYKTKYQGRRMTWQYFLGHVSVQFRPNPAGPKYNLLVSLCQALVLLQFNGGEVIKLPNLMASVGLDDRSEMERILQSLTMGKEGTRVLKKQDHDAEQGKKRRTSVHDNDSFRVHTGFKSPSRRIRITNIMMKETKEEREKTVEGVSRDRLYLIDAVLVRIMKARKTILHQQLIPQVLEQAKVPAQPADVKKRIESLIEREYMERDAKDRNRYNYLA
jgi:cullin-4